MNLSMSWSPVASGELSPLIKCPISSLNDSDDPLTSACELVASSHFWNTNFSRGNRGWLLIIWVIVESVGILVGR